MGARVRRGLSYHPLETHDRDRDARARPFRPVPRMADGRAPLRFRHAGRPADPGGRGAQGRDARAVGGRARRGHGRGRPQYSGRRGARRRRGHPVVAAVADDAHAAPLESPAQADHLVPLHRGRAGDPDRHLLRALRPAAVRQPQFVPHPGVAQGPCGRGGRGCAPRGRRPRIAERRRPGGERARAARQRGRRPSRRGLACRRGRRRRPLCAAKRPRARPARRRAGGGGRVGARVGAGLSPAVGPLRRVRRHPGHWRAAGCGRRRHGAGRPGVRAGRRVPRRAARRGDRRRRAAVGPGEGAHRGGHGHHDRQREPRHGLAPAGAGPGRRAGRGAGGRGGSRGWRCWTTWTGSPARPSRCR